ncbi:hypothetical protein NC651_035635 [Populus alba x Populus x berolinensis]|nr:hypothetical protein NC651_035635 [Populus alba x Populus x berolinensis]
MIRKKFDEDYGPAWHCVIGKNFGSCITLLCGSFIFFRVEMLRSFNLQCWQGLQ